MRIAIIDDLKGLTKVVKEQIQSLDTQFVCDLYENGKEFIDTYLQNGIPTAILLDIQMPIMDGFDLSKWFNWNLPYIPVIVYTEITHKDAFSYLYSKGIKSSINKFAPVLTQLNAIKHILSGGFHFEYGDGITLTRDSLNELANENNLLKLTFTEFRILKLMCTNLTVHEIVEKTGLKLRSYDNIRSNVFKKLGFCSREQVLTYGFEIGFRHN